MRGALAVLDRRRWQPCRGMRCLRQPVRPSPAQSRGRPAVRPATGRTGRPPRLSQLGGGPAFRSSVRQGPGEATVSQGIGRPRRSFRRGAASDPTPALGHLNGVRAKGSRAFPLRGRTAARRPAAALPGIGPLEGTRSPEPKPPNESLHDRPGRAAPAPEGGRPRPPPHHEPRPTVAHRAEPVVEMRLLVVPESVGVPPVGRPERDRVTFPAPTSADVVNVLEDDVPSGSTNDLTSEMQGSIFAGDLRVLGGEVGAPAIGNVGRNPQENLNVKSLERSALHESPDRTASEEGSPPKVLRRSQRPSSTHTDRGRGPVLRVSERF